MNNLIKCVVYECMTNEQGKCTGDEHGVEPNSVICNKRQFRLVKRIITEDIIEDRMMVERLRTLGKGE